MIIIIKIFLTNIYWLDYNLTGFMCMKRVCVFINECKTTQFTFANNCLVKNKPENYEFSKTLFINEV